MADSFLSIRIDPKSVSKSLANLQRIRGKGYIRQAVRPGVNKSASILNKASKVEARKVGRQRFRDEEFGVAVVRPKDLAKSIGIRRKTYTASGVVLAVVGPRFDFVGENDVEPSKYAAFIEGALETDSMMDSPRPFMLPAAKANLNRMRDVFIDNLRIGTDKVIKKIRLKGGDI